MKYVTVARSRTVEPILMPADVSRAADTAVSIETVEFCLVHVGRHMGRRIMTPAYNAGSLPCYMDFVNASREFRHLSGRDVDCFPAYGWADYVSGSLLFGAPA